MERSEWVPIRKLATLAMFTDSAIEAGLVTLDKWKDQVKTNMEEQNIALKVVIDSRGRKGSKRSEYLYKFGEALGLKIERLEDQLASLRDKQGDYREELEEKLGELSSTEWLPTDAADLLAIDVLKYVKKDASVGFTLAMSLTNPLGIERVARDFGIDLGPRELYRLRGGVVYLVTNEEYERYHFRRR